MVHQVGGGEGNPTKDWMKRKKTPNETKPNTLSGPSPKHLKGQSPNTQMGQAEKRKSKTNPLNRQRDHYFWRNYKYKENVLRN